MRAQVSEPTGRYGRPYRGLSLAPDVHGEPFYTPDPSMFRHNDGYRMYTEYAAALVQAGLGDRFPGDAGLRARTVELLAERCPVADVLEDPDTQIAKAVEEARRLL